MSTPNEYPSENDLPQKVPDGLPPESYEHPVEFHRQKRNVLLAAIALSFVAGVISAFIEDGSSKEEFILAIAIFGEAILLMSWCVYDSYERDYRMSRALRIVIVLFAGVGYPYYLLRTRGVRGLITLFVTVLIWFALAFVFALTSEIFADIVN